MSIDPKVTTRSPSREAYTVAIAELPTDQIHAESRRLDTSAIKLRETNETLCQEEFKHESFAIEALQENAELLQSYIWRHMIIRDELQKRGASIPSHFRDQGDDTSEDHNDAANGLEL